MSRAGSGWPRAGRPRRLVALRPMAPRACLIVLDAVGAGELPDAAAYGDAGSSTLQHVAEAVGGLDLPNLQALGLGNVLPLAGCAPRADAPSVAGRLREHSAGQGHDHRPLGADGRDHRDGDADVPGRVPRRRDRRLRRGDRTGGHRQRAGVGHRDHRAARGGAPAHRQAGSSTPPPTPSSRSPHTSRPCRSRSSTRPAGSRAGSSRARTRSGASSRVRSRASRAPTVAPRTATTSRSSRRARTT